MQDMQDMTEQQFFYELKTNPYFIAQFLYYHSYSNVEEAIDERLALYNEVTG